MHLLSFELLLFLTFLPEDGLLMLSDRTSNSFSLFELLIVEDSILLAIKTQESGNIKSVFSNILGSSVFFFAVKDDFIEFLSFYIKLFHQYLY